MINVSCPFCQQTIDGVNPGDLINNLRIHFEDECEAIDPDEAANL